MNRTMKVALACFIGTALGIITMHGLYPSLWPLGLVMGFFGGYMSYEYKAVIRAIPVAWHKATSWRPDKRYWRAFYKNFLNYTSSALILSSFFVFWAIVHTIYLYELEGVYDGDPRSIWGILALGLFFLICGAITMPGLILVTFWSTEALENEFVFIPPTLSRFYFQLLPRWLGEISSLVAKAIVVAINFLFEIVPVAVRFIGKFVRHLFKLIHKEERLLCGIDAAIGSAVFHYAGNNVFLGLVVGVAWGVLNFEVFSIRVLKLVPAEVSILYRIRH